MTASLAVTDLASYLPVLIIVLAAVGFGVGNMVATFLIGPSRKGGKNKSVAYESGMNPVGTARKRFNIRFPCTSVLRPYLMVQELLKISNRT